MKLSRTLAASALALAMLAPLATPRAADVGHNLYNGLGGQNAYLAPGERMYAGDYMIADHAPYLGEPAELIYTNGNLSLWWYNNSGLQCDPTGGCAIGWRMIWSSGTTVADGFFYNGTDGNACIWDNGLSAAVWCTNTNGAGNFYVYQYSNDHFAHPGCALQSRISDGNTTWTNPQGC